MMITVMMMMMVIVMGTMLIMTILMLIFTASYMMVMISGSLQLVWLHVCVTTSIFLFCLNISRLLQLLGGFQLREHIGGNQKDLILTSEKGNDK